MSVDENDTTGSANAASLSNGFDAAMTLLAVIADQKACADRLAQLRQAALDAERATAELQAARATHDAEVERDRTAVAAQRKKLAEKEMELIARESQAKAAEKRRLEDDAAFRVFKNRGKEVIGPSGLTREYADIDPRPNPFAAAKSDPPPLARKTRGPVRVGREGTTLMREQEL
jgi:hypothetical protein